jgi:hypothetical protein
VQRLRAAALEGLRDPDEFDERDGRHDIRVVARVERQRNPGTALCIDRAVPDFAPLNPSYTLHPGYTDQRLDM